MQDISLFKYLKCHTFWNGSSILQINDCTEEHVCKISLKSIHTFGRYRDLTHTRARARSQKNIIFFFIPKQEGIARFARSSNQEYFYQLHRNYAWCFSNGWEFDTEIWPNVFVWLIQLLFVGILTIVTHKSPRYVSLMLSCFKRY